MTTTGPTNPAPSRCAALAGEQRRPPDVAHAEPARPAAVRLRTEEEVRAGHVRPAPSKDLKRWTDDC